MCAKITEFGIYNYNIYRLLHFTRESHIIDDFQMHCKDVWYIIINPYEDILANAEIDLIDPQNTELKNKQLLRRWKSLQFHFIVNTKDDPPQMT